MKTMVLVSGEKDAKCAFHKIIDSGFSRSYVLDLGKEYLFNHFDEIEKFIPLNEYCYNCVSGTISDIENKEEDIILMIEGFNKKLSKDIQDDFPIFEIKLVDKMGVLSNTAFTLNWKSEDFEKEAVELITKLAF